MWANDIWKKICMVPKVVKNLCRRFLIKFLSTINKKYYADVFARNSSSNKKSTVCWWLFRLLYNCGGSCFEDYANSEGVREGGASVRIVLTLSTDVSIGNIVEKDLRNIDRNQKACWYIKIMLLMMRRNYCGWYDLSQASTFYRG